MTGQCMSCGRSTGRDELHAYCAVCEGRMGRGPTPPTDAQAGGARAVLLGMARKPADAAKLADAVLTLRNYVLSAEVEQRPKYLTSSTNGDRK